MTFPGPRSPGGSLGTFAGVFTPSILTILGIILFLRLGFVVGNAGMGQALVIIGLANLISVLTSFSLAAVATNLRVKRGGDYYLISRTLGLEFGGAIGIVLFLAQSVSIAFYCIGFGEAVAAMTGIAGPLYPQMIAGLAVLLLFVLAWLGADWATRFQYVVMAFLGLALVSFYMGGVLRWDTGLLVRNWSGSGDSPGFWILFAVFFPAVTGFTQGVSMSGELRDPGRSLPLGTFMAVGISIAVYFSVAVILAAALPSEILTTDYGAMKKAASWGIFIDAGVISATLSSAMASFLGAPRILQSLASDKIFPFLNRFSAGYGPSNNPRPGVLLSLAIALVAIALGQLDLIARVVSMFFLISYGLLNGATYFEARTASPSFRPRFRLFHPWISLAGFLACLGAMLAIDFKTGVIAVAILTSIYHYLKQTSGPARWADGQRSYHLKNVRENLLAAQEDPDHPRDWRPFILAVSPETRSRESLLRLGGWLEGGSGMTAAVHILEGKGARMARLWAREREELSLEIRRLGLDAFPMVITAESHLAGVEAAIQCFGIGAVHANTVLFNRHEPAAGGEASRQALPDLVRSVFRLDCNTLILDLKAGGWEALDAVPPDQRRIDVWWKGDNTSRLMLLLAYLMSRSDAWEACVIRLLAMDYDKDTVQSRESLQAILDEIRISAVPVIIPGAGDDTVVDWSRDTSLVFLPFSVRRNMITGPMGTPCDDLLERLGSVVLALASQDMDLDAEPEEGPVQELADLMDTLERARDRAKKVRDQADEAQDRAKEAMMAVGLSGSLMDDGQVLRLKAALDARRSAETAGKKAAREQEEVRKAAEQAGARGLPANESGGEEPEKDIREKEI
ncbi:MAG: amino acid permease [Pseudomonadota bacterium]